jgi:hypothetical protein
VINRGCCFRWFAAIAASVVLIGGSVANRAEAAFETIFAKYSAMISDDLAKEAAKLALTRVDQTTCESDRPCAPATPEEFSQPPISTEDARAALTFGLISALAQWCGLDWKRNFLPMIAYGKNQKRMSDRQLQLMTLIHGDFQRRHFAFYTKSGSCPADFRNELDAELPKLGG